jgi:hypothetical protein
MNTANLVYHVFKITTTKCGIETKEVLGVALSKLDALVVARKEQADLINDRRMTQKLQLLGFMPSDPVQLMGVAA